MNFRKSIHFFLLLLFFQASFAQSPYRLSWQKESLVLGTGGALMGLGEYLGNRTPLFTPDEILTLDPNDINGFDRLATEFSSDDAHQLSNYFWWGSHALPLVFLAGNDTRGDAAMIGLLYFETTLATAGLTQSFKSIFRRPRPFVFDPDAEPEKKQSRNAKASFVSGHTSMAASNSFFVARVFADFYPDSKWKPLVWTAAAAIPAVTGYLRVRAGRHYPTDALAGYALGASMGYLVPYFHRNKKRKHANVQLGIGYNSGYLSVVF